MYLALSLGFGFLSLSLGIFGLALVSDAVRLRSRARNLLSWEDVEPDAPTSTRLGGPSRVWRRLTSPLARFVPEATRKKLCVRLADAGLAHRINEAEILLLWLLVFLFGLFGGFRFFQWLAPINLLQGILGGLLLAVVGALLPNYWLNSRVEARRYQLRKSLPDVLDLLVVSVEAGIGFDAGLARIRDHFSGPLAEEFRRVLDELRLGKSRADALRAMAVRCNTPDVTLFVTAICQADQLGVSVSQVIRVQADTLRQRRVFHIREMAQKLPVKLLFPLIFCIFPALFVVILAPGILRIYEAFLQ